MVKMCLKEKGKISTVGDDCVKAVREGDGDDESGNTGGGSGQSGLQGFSRRRHLSRGL